MPSQRLSRELSLANGVAAVAGFEAGVAPKAGSQHLQHPVDQQQRSKRHDDASTPRPFPLTRKNPKPFANYVVVIVLYLFYE